MDWMTTASCTTSASPSFTYTTSPSYPGTYTICYPYYGIPSHVIKAKKKEPSYNLDKEGW